MAADRSTRDRVLDAFETILVASGSRAATLEAVAAHAEVSKGGLLYHFGSKDELIDGMLTRLREQGAADVEKMRAAKNGPGIPQGPTRRQAQSGKPVVADPDQGQPGG